MLWLLLLHFSAFAQDLPTYSVPAVIVTPTPLFLTPDPDVIVEVPAHATPKAATLDDVLRGASGTVVNRAGGPGQPSSVFLRGAASEHTLVLLDGVEINDPSQPTGGFDFSTIDLNQVERVEIFKGPQALRFGSGAVGGVINIVTRKGGGPTKVAVAAKIGSHQTQQQTVSTTGEAGAVKYAFSITRYETEGISAARGYEELDGHRYLASALRLSVEKNGEEWELLNRILSSRSDLDFSTSSSGPYFLEPDDANYAVGGFHSATALKRSERSDKWSSDLTVSHFYLQRRYENKRDSRNSSYFLDNRYSNSFKGERVFAYQVDPDTTITFGPAARHEQSGKHNDTIYGAFIEGGIKKDWRASVGFRYDVHRFGGQFTYSVSPGYRFKSSRTTVSARWATAFKRPSLFQLHDSAYGNHNLQPEKVRGEEVSVEQLLGQSHALRLIGFRYFYSDLIQFSSRYENVALARVAGAELEYSKDFSQGFDLNVAYTYTDPRNQQTGRRLPRRPLQSWRASLGTRIGDSWSARAEWRGLGSRPDINALSATATTTPSYDLLDVSVTRTLGRRTQITASVENAFAQSYEEISGYGTPGFGAYVGGRHQFE